MSKRLLAVAAAGLFAVFGFIGVQSGTAHATTLNCEAYPHTCGYPDATNSGVPTGTKLTAVPGTITSGTGWTWLPTYQCVDVTGANATLNALDIAGCVYIEASGVTLSNDNITPPVGSAWGVAIASGNNTNVNHSSIQGTGDTGGATPDLGALPYGIKDVNGNTTGNSITYNNISVVNAGIGVNQGNIQHNYLHTFDYSCIGDDANTTACGTPADCTPYICSHNDGIYVNGPSPAGLSLYKNTVFQNLWQTDAIILGSPVGGTTSNVTVHYNMVAGGSYAIYGGCGNQGSLTPSNIIFDNNRFADQYYTHSGQYGYNTYVCTDPAYNEKWTNNIDDLSGATVAANT